MAEILKNLPGCSGLKFQAPGRPADSGFRGKTSLLLFVLIASQSVGLAHRLDEYLQATLVVIEPKMVRLQINLTPGVEVAEQVLALIDRNHDGVISTNEAAAYSQILKRDLTVRLDGRKLPLQLTASSFPAPSEMRTGWGIMQLEFTGNFSLLAPGAHKLSIDNRHLPDLSVYLINAAQPKSSSVQIVKQRRKESQSAGEIEFSINRSGK